MKYNQKGFSVVEFVLIVIIIGILGGVGWYVYSQQSKDQQGVQITYGNNNSAEQSEQPSDGSRDVCGTDFSIIVPAGWYFFTIENGGNCGVSNLAATEQPPVGLLAGEDISFIFSTETLEDSRGLDRVVEEFFAPTEDAYPISLVSQEEIELDNGSKAIIALGEGGHYGTREDYFFYKKDNQLITTSWNAESMLTEKAREVIRTLE